MIRWGWYDAIGTGGIALFAISIRRMTDRNAPPVYTSRGQVEGEDWPAVAAALNERMAARRVGQQELATLSGVSVSTLRQVQHGAGRRVQNKTLSAISKALDWPEGYLTDVLVSGQRCEPATQVDGEDQVLDALHQMQEQLRQMSQQLAALATVIGDRSQPSNGPGQRGTSGR
jgi:DNA-binding Xre family transcriptional regulator